MRILLIPGQYHPHDGGGSYYLSRLVERLKEYGHEFKGICYCKEAFAYNEIEFVPMGGMETMFAENNHLVEWCDVIFTQLLGNSYAYNKSVQHKKPMVFFAHNTANHYFVNNARVVYNSNWMASLGIFTNECFVQYPIIPKADPVNGSKIALVNCNRMKGVELFNKLASELPYQFLGIKGAYGEQITCDGIEYREHSPDIDWSDIKLLLVPSQIESWSQVASEAIMRGIPVIASPLDGIRENLSYAGIYISPNDIHAWKVAIEWLMDCEDTYRKQSEMCLKRASEYSDDVSKFNEWLIGK